ncbi:GGDEF domain-containing protein [Kineosporia sp. NBRC 101731]|uniref:GGDEF domain-containing protein n=1 Tax=Kineosporia sp. NBRC 101731 TaxID=3032199 RepID=UPI0024A5304E|nr:GGDEF domain-containing protein [Kineosporia sp. NBRC 101731]GLY29270.1 hypothetical protein Kisp02_26350 [Kineosporia sp. NBRC 101731]
MPGSRGWQWYTWVCGVVVLGYLAVPSETAQAVIAGLVYLTAMVAILVGVRRHRPGTSWSWYVLAVKVALFGAAEVAYWVQSLSTERDAFPSIADALYLPSSLLLIVVLIAFTLARHREWDRAGLLDAAVLSIGAGMLAWLYLISPTAHSGDLSVLGRTVSLAYPILDLLALAVLLRLAIGSGRRPVAYRLLVGGVITLLVTDAIYTLLELAGAYQAGGVLDSGWLVSHILFASAALHPSMPELSQPTPPVPEGVIGRRRLYALAVASLMAPLVLIIEWLRHEAIDAPVIAGGSIGLYLLVLARLHGVVQQLASSLDTAQSQANTDLLTGLANRRLFYSRWSRSLAEAPGPTALLYLDLDGFKAVNDTLGHETGDAVLQTVADRIRQVVRSGDVIARLGGDEFAIMLPGATDEHAGDIAARIVAAVSVPMTIQGAPVRVGASIGVILAPPGSDPDTEIKRADTAMYGAKTAGRGRVVQA